MQTDRYRRPIGNLSHVQGSTGEALWDITVPSLLHDTVERFPDADAAVFLQQGLRRTYRQFEDDVDRVALGLLEFGIGRGDRIGVWSPNRYEWLLSQFASARIGAILVCINPAYRLAELDFALNKVGCKALVTARSFKSSDYAAMLLELCPELSEAGDGELVAARVPALKRIFCMGDDVPEGMIGFDRLLEIGAGRDVSALDAICRDLSCEDPINIQFTSGTTGNPKGACLTHRNIVNNARFVTECIELGDKDRLCIPVPLYHCFGMVMGTLGCVTKGAAMVFPGEGFDPLATLRAVAEERCTALYGVPTMFVAELEHPDFAGFDLSSLRTGIMAGASCPIEVMKAVQTRMHMRGITIAYGMTETSPVSFQSSPRDPVEKIVATVGRIQPHVEVRIVGPDGKTLPVGEPGEILTRGYSVMKGYWNDPGKTAEAIDADGWMHTGDIGQMDEDGFCAITGRIKDMIIRGGENVYPREIEEFLFTLDGVQQAQVFGVPDEKYGEIVCAWIVPKAGATVDPDRVRESCRASLSYFKVPVHVSIRDQLPMTVTGKPQKFIMREQMIEELSSQSN